MRKSVKIGETLCKYAISPMWKKHQKLVLKNYWVLVWLDAPIVALCTHCAKGTPIDTQKYHGVLILGVSVLLCLMGQCLLLS